MRTMLSAIIVSIGVGLAVLGIVVFSTKQTKPQASSVTGITPALQHTVTATKPVAIQQANEQTTLAVPMLFPRVTWTRFQPDESKLRKSLGKESIYVSGKKYGTSSIDGQEWEGSAKNLTREEINTILNDFRNYYASKLTAKGWATEVAYTGYKLSPLFADGPGGSIYGYITLKNGQLRAVILMEETPIENFGSIAKCPCSIGFRVFVSEIVPISGILERIK